MTARSLLFFGLIAFPLMMPAAAQAQNCDRAVIDEAGVLGDGVSRVETAARELTAAGADVRVRVIRTFGSAGSLDRYEAAMERGCPSWQSADGGTKNNLVALFVAVSDRKTGLYYGSLFKRSLDSRWLAIQTDEMNPRFRDGDFAGGIAAGLDEIARVVTARVHAYDQPAEAPVQRPYVEAKPTVIQTQPTDYTGLWIVLGSIVGLAALILLVIFAVRLSRARARRLAAQQKAKQLKNACSDKILELTEALPILDSKVKGLANKVSDEDAAPLLERQTKAARGLDAATSAFADLQNSAGNPHRDGKSYEEYAQMQTAYREVLDRLEKVRTETAEIEAAVAKLKKAVDAAPEAVTATAAAIEAAADVCAKVESQGYRTGDAREVLTDADKGLTDAKSLLAQKRFTATILDCEDAAKLAKHAANLAAALPKKRTELDAAIRTLTSRTADVKAKIGQGRQTFEAIASEYAESCWSVIRGNGTEAENRAEAADEAALEAAKAASMEAQEWQRCSDILAEADKGLDEAESFMRSIAELKKNLDEAKAGAADDIAHALRDIDAARTFIHVHADDINDPLEDRMISDLDEAADAVARARNDLGAAKPDYLAVVKTARQAEKAADAILTRAQGEYEAAERLRRRAASALRDAERAVSAAKEYIEDHSSDVDSGARSRLSQAWSHLIAARAAATLEDRISQGEQADKLADSALSMARRDVSDAEEARAAERRRRAAAAAAAARRSSSSSSSGLGGFGGSSGWGSSSGGGSSGWGSSSRGGGSSGW